MLPSATMKLYLLVGLAGVCAFGGVSARSHQLVTGGKHNERNAFDVRGRNNNNDERNEAASDLLDLELLYDAAANDNNSGINMNRRLGHDVVAEEPAGNAEPAATTATDDATTRPTWRQVQMTDEPTGLTAEPTMTTIDDSVNQMILEEFEEMGDGMRPDVPEGALVPVPAPEPTASPTPGSNRDRQTDEPTGDSPWWEPKPPTPKPTNPPTLRPTPKPTPAPVSPPPTSAPVLPTVSPTSQIESIMANIKETLEPTAEPTSEPLGDDGTGTGTTAGGDGTPYVQPIVLDRWVRVNLKDVPAGQTMNNIQTVAFEDVATTFLADLFQLTVPVVYDLGVEVTGQNVLDGIIRRNVRSLRTLQDGGDESSPGDDSAAAADGADAADEPELYPLQVDMRVSGKFDPTDVHRTADDVNFDSMCRNFFTVNGGAVVSQLNAMADQAMEEGVEELDGSGLEYFATVQEIRGVTPPTTGIGAGGGDDEPELLNTGDGGKNNQLAYIIAIAVGSVAFVGLVGTMFFIARKNKRNKRGGAGGDDRSSSKKSKSSRSKSSKANGSSSSASKKYSPKKKSKQSPAALSMMSDEERADALPPGPIDSPEEAQSEVGSLARFHTLEADDYQYSLEDGLGKSPKSLGPLFQKRSNDNGMAYDDSSGNANGTSNLYSPQHDEHDDDHDEDGFGDAADDATFSDFGKMLSSSFSKSPKSNGNTPTNGADEFRQKDSMMNFSPSTADAGSPLSPAIPEEPEEKPKKKKKKKTFGASARKNKGASALNTSGEWSEASSAQESAKVEQPKNSNYGDLSIDGRAAGSPDKKDPLSPDADAWLYETITDVLGDDQSAKSGRSGTSGFSSNSPEKKLSSFGKKKKKKSRSKNTPQAIQEDAVAEDTNIPTPMEYTPGGDDKSVMTTVTKLEDAGMVRRECYAPPGKLGVVIDSTSKGPVVHEVKGGSPLEGIVFPGDRIIAIDGEDTRTLPASMVTKIMAAKKDQQRRMTLLSVVTGIDG